MSRRCRSCEPVNHESSPGNSKNSESLSLSRLTRCRRISQKAAMFCRTNTKNIYEKLILQTYQKNKQLLDDVGLGLLVAFILWMMYREFCLCFTGFLWSTASKGMGIFGCAVVLMILLKKTDSSEDLVPSPSAPPEELSEQTGSENNRKNRDDRNSPEGWNLQDDSGTSARRDRRRRDRRRQD
uniref:Uncharacterized protein n=1 Tax=Fopius arisanus TaxID=64838 RepID=A0A0C9RLD7_9HYME